MIGKQRKRFVNRAETRFTGRSTWYQCVPKLSWSLLGCCKCCLGLLATVLLMRIYYTYTHTTHTYALTHRYTGTQCLRVVATTDTVTQSRRCRLPFLPALGFLLVLTGADWGFAVADTELIHFIVVLFTECKSQDFGCVLEIEI